MGAYTSHETKISRNVHEDGCKYSAEFDRQHFSKGSLRYVFRGKYRGNGSMANKNCVTKVFKATQAKNFSHWEPDLSASRKAQTFAEVFNTTVLNELNITVRRRLKFVIPLIAKTDKISRYKVFGLIPVRQDRRYSDWHGYTQGIQYSPKVLASARLYSCNLRSVTGMRNPFHILRDGGKAHNVGIIFTHVRGKEIKSAKELGILQNWHGWHPFEERNCVPKIVPVLLYVLPQEYVAIEPFLEGDYVKFNSNGGYECDSNVSLLLPAFSHWTWHVSDHQYMVCDLQGVKSQYDYKLTDPVVHSVYRKFGRTDLGVIGMECVLANHKCNEICWLLKLQNPMRNVSIQVLGGRRTSYSFELTMEQRRRNEQGRNRYFQCMPPVVE